MAHVPASAGFSVLIPARLASTRLPNKPLADIAGMPMVVRVALRARQSGAQQCVVAADDERILKACSEHGIDAVLTRQDHASGSDRLAEACDRLGLAAPAHRGQHHERRQVVVQRAEAVVDPTAHRRPAGQHQA